MLTACAQPPATGLCSDATCSSHGECYDDGISAWCVCEPGYRADGLACVLLGGDADGDVDEDSIGDTGIDGDAHDPDALDGDLDAATDPDPEDEPADPCSGDCAERVASECSCEAVDRCGWAADGTCDQACVELLPGAHFDDLDDCDHDLDGLYDGEELALAIRFEPWLWLSPREEGFRAERLPHFAVEPTGDGALTVFYALSYAEDYGDPDLGGFSSHRGDTEFLAVEALPDAGGVFRVARVYLSAHHGEWNDASAWFDFDQLSFEEDEAGNLHPLVYVAEWKHANYRNLGECDMGSFFADHCAEGTLEPVGVAAGRNLGNAVVPLLDDVEHDGNHERYWSRMRFCGWREPSLDSGPRRDCSRPYQELLDLWTAGEL